MATNKRPSSRAARDKQFAEINRQVLSEWRGCEEVPDLNAGIRRADQFISAILQSAGFQDGVHEDELRAAWKELAGDFIARNSEPTSVKGGHLVLRVTQPAMRFHLEQMKPMLLSRIRDHFGDQRILSIKFSLG